MSKKVKTVLGEIEINELGITDAHNHLWISKQALEVAAAPVLDQRDKIVNDLVAYRQLGGGSQVDCQPGGAGRDGNHLRFISKASGVHVIACTGFHLKSYYPVDYKIWKMDINQAVEYLLDEIEEGLEETRHDKPIFPGFIKIAVGETLRDSPQDLMEAAFIASKESGLLIEMHTEKGANVEDFLTFFEHLGLENNRLVICHIDKRPDPGLHIELAKAGYLLEYDTFFRPKYQPNVNLWPLLSKMVNAGLSKSIAIATDLADSTMWNSMGEGPGLVGFIKIIKNRMDSEFNDPIIVDQLIGGNISNRLAVD
jgi:predicted metal-dependent phosphotriesterase family hydrolase